MTKQRDNTLDATQDTSIRRKLERVANTANRSDKVSWNRKMDAMVKLISEIKPLQDQILELEALKQPILDQIAELRGIMRRECIHPFEHLTSHENYVLCKFCDHKIVALDDIEAE